jgi:HK97 family phage portal protein
MGWLTDWMFEPVNEIRAEPQTQTQTAITPPVDDVLLQALLNNETITRDKALTLPAVSGAVDFIGNSVASMPVKLYKVKDGKVEEVEKDSRVRLLNGDTGDTLDAFQMKKAMVEDYLLGKGGYCYIRRNRNDVTGLYYVEDRYIEIWKSYEPIYKTYKLLVMGEEYEPYDFIKLLRNTKDGASGVGLTVQISKELETAYQTLLYQLGMVKAGGNKKGFLKANRRLGQDEIDVLKQAWTNMYANNTENVVVLNNGLEFQEASNTSVEMQMNESKKTLQDEINNLFHISDDFDLTFKLAIYPIVKAFETALNRDLLLEKEKKNHFFEFDVKEIIRANLKERYESYKLAKETGFMTLNEIRRSENLNYVEGLDVVNVGLGAVLYDTNKHVYYTPNTDTIGNVGDADEDMTKMLEGHELAEAYDESGNSAERDIKENDEEVT